MTDDCSSCDELSLAARVYELFGVDIEDRTIADAAGLLSAKKYLCSAQQLKDGHCQKLYCRTSEVFDRLIDLRDNVERQSCAALKFTIVDNSNDGSKSSKALQRKKKQFRSPSASSSFMKSRIVEIAGSDDCMTSAIEMMHSSFGRDCFTVADSRLTSMESDDEDDSSYDSDHESVIVQHDEVSRTVSDTLAAEFAEYVGTSPELSGRKSYNDDDPTYTSRVEFALKLGYTEWQVQVALQKLGPKPEQNELLAELIKLGAAASAAATSSISTSSTGFGSVARDDHQSLMSRSGVVGGRRPLSANDGVESSGILDSMADFKLDEPEPRPIVIDGSNVAMSHGNKDVFSCRGIKLCVDWFRARGHSDITVFVPMWRKEASRPDAQIKDQEILLDLEREGLLVFTPSRQMGGRRVACHDDRYVIRLAAETDAVVVSNDNYRDLAAENAVFKRVVEERLLMFSFANDRFMPPDDPLGRHGPSLDSFLVLPRSPNHQRSGYVSRQQTSPKPSSTTSVATLSTVITSASDLPPPCPYGKKCTYGNKCKYYHPERGSHPHKSVCEQLAEQAKINIQEVKSRRGLPELKAVLSSPLPNKTLTSKTPLTRTKSLVPPAKAAGPQQEVNLLPDFTSVTKQPSSDVKSASGDGQPQQQHRKLERQLTFNPVYDPRLVHLLNQIEAGSGGHAPLGMRHSSGSGSDSVGGVASDLRPFPPDLPAHQSVTRIASAPDSYRQWHPPPSIHHHTPHLQRTISTSDTQLHHYHQHQFAGAAAAAAAGFRHHPFQSGATPPYNYLPQPSFSHPPPSPAPPMFQSSEEQRYRLYYHLSSLFPEEQVRAAMEKHPHETDPQNICAAIFTMFPKPTAASSPLSPKCSIGNIPSTFQQQPR